MKGLVRFASDHLGLDLYPGQVDVLTDWAKSGKRKAIFALGRRSGKGLMAAVAAIHNAAIADYTGLLRPGESRFVLVVATRQEQAREFIRTVRELLAEAPDPDLRALVDVAASTVDEIRFKTGVVIRAMPCSSRSVRGLAASLVVFDEAAHFQTETDGFQAFRGVWRALVPSVAQFGPRGYVLVTSTPLWPTGPFYELFRAGETGADPDMHVVRRPTWDMNVHITRESLEAEFLADPEGAAVEFGADFAEGVGAFLNAAAVYDCVAKGRRELAPFQPVRYVSAIDPAFSAGGDAFTLAIAHKTGAGAVIDCLRSWRGKSSPLSSDAVLDEIADLLRSYGIASVVSDQFALIPISDGLARRGIAVRAQPLTAELKASIFGSLKRAVNLGDVELLDNRDLLAELLALEIRPSPSGKPRIAAAGRAHDDLAMVVATVVHTLMSAGATDPAQLRALGSVLSELRQGGNGVPLSSLVARGSIREALR